jgi:O-antigen/teichoic acid export membrane protein
MAKVGAEPADTAGKTVQANAARTLSVRVLGLLVSLGTTLVITRYLDPANRGRFALVVMSITIAVTLVGNLGVAASHELTKVGMDSREHVTALVRSCLVFTLGLGLLGGAGVYAVLIPLVGAGSLVAMCSALAVPAAALSQTGGAILVALGRVQAWNLIQIASKVGLCGAAVIALPVLHDGLTGASEAYLISQLLGLVVAGFATRSTWPGGAGRILRGRTEMLRLGVTIGVVNTVSIANYRVELVLLDAIGTVSEVGVYALATSIAELVWVLSSSLSIAVTGPVVRGDEADATRSIWLVARAALLLAAATAIVVGLAGYFAIPTLFGERYSGARVPLLVLLPGVVAFAPLSIISQYYTVRRGSPAWPLRAVALSGGVTAILAAALIPQFELIGAAAACTAGYLIGSTALFIRFMRDTNYSSNLLLPRASDLRAISALLRRSRTAEPVMAEPDIPGL